MPFSVYLNSYHCHIIFVTVLKISSSVHVEEERISILAKTEKNYNTALKHVLSYDVF